jgi:hypothetical protein
MTEPTPTTVYPWLSAVAPIGTFVLGFVSAVFAEPLRQWLFRPKIELTFEKDSAHVAKTPERGNEEAYYIRIGVVTKSRRIAKQCRAYLVQVEEKESSTFISTTYVDSIQLAWSCRVLGTELNPVDLPPGVVQFVDLVATNSTCNSYRPQIKPFPFRYRDLFSSKQQTLRFTVQVSGDGFDPEIIKVVFCWNGTWDNFDVSRDTESPRMAQ